MALRFRELPWYVQILIYFVLAALIFAGGKYLDYSPVKQAADIRVQKEIQLKKLQDEVNQLRAVEQRLQEFRTLLAAAEEQLARLRTLVPEEKQTDEFIRLLQGSASGSQVAMRRLTARDAVMREFYAELPFEVQMDGAYASLVNFFRALAGRTRLINAGAVRLEGVEGARGQYDYAPGTTVVGTTVVTTYYTPSEAELAAAAPPRPGQPGGRPQPRR